LADLTEIARKGEMDPVIGRRNEIERVIQILCAAPRQPVSWVKPVSVKPQSSKVWLRNRQRQRS